MHRKSFSLIVSMGLFLPLAFTRLAAGDSSWNGTSSQLFDDPNNWTPAQVPGSGDNATFPTIGSGTTSVDFGGNLTSVNQVTFTNTASPYTLSDGTLDTPTIDQSDAQEQNDIATTLTSNTGALQIGAGAGLVVSGPIVDPGVNNPLTLFDASTTLTAANTYSGPTFFTPFEGSTLAGDGTILDSPSIELGQGASLTVSDVDAQIQTRLNPSATISLTDATFDYEANNSTQNIGTLDLVRGANTISANLNSSSGGGTLSAATLTRGSERANVYVNLGSNSDSVAQVILTNASEVMGDLYGGGEVPGTTNQAILPWTISNNNGINFVTYDANGLRELTDSEYADSVAGGSGANVKTSGDEAVSSGNVNSLITSNNVAISPAGTLSIGSGALAFYGGGQISGGSSATLEFGPQEGVVYVDQNTSSTIDAVIDGTNGLTKFGQGTLELSEANTYQGDTVINEGTLVSHVQGGIGGSGTIVIAGYNLDLAFDTVDQSYSNSVVVSNTYFPTGPFGSSGNFANISVDSGHTVTFSGSFAGQGNSDGILNSNGAGTVRLTGSGSNLTLGGNFEIDGDFSNNVYFFNFNGTTVGGSGTFFQLQGLGGTVAPIGRLTVAQYLDSGSTLSIHLNGVTAGVQPGGYDQLVTTQSVNLAGTLQLLLGFQPNPGTLFTIISNTSDTAVQGTFAGLGQGAEFAQGGAEYSINYAGGNDGTDVVVDFLGVPEPTSISAILIVMVIMLRRRRVIRLGS